MTDKDTPPAWTAIQIDETRHWSAEFLKKYGVTQIYGVYLYDANSRIYCCEMTPSYELSFIESVAGHGIDDEEVWEKFTDDVREADMDADEVIYMHCHDIDGMPAKDKKDLGFDLTTDGGAWWSDEDRGYDTVLEDYQGSPVF